MKWTPAAGARSAAHRLGKDEAIRQLCVLLIGVDMADVAGPPWHRLIRDIADVDAGWVVESPARGYWPRAWAGRALAYIGDHSAVTSLVEASGDGHWRVRMNAVRALGVIGGPEPEPAVIRASRDPHPRVRSAAATALVSIGGVGVFSALTRLAADPDPRVISRAEVALERLARSD